MMNTTYAKQNSTIQNEAKAKAASILDSSSQSEGLQRKADMANQNYIQSPFVIQYVKSKNDLIKRNQHSKGTGKKPSTRYSVGTHGYNKLMRRKLHFQSNLFESEHVIGYAVLADGLKRGKSTPARLIENIAPAFFMKKRYHRGHIGTGQKGRISKPALDPGMNSEEYRNWTRKMLIARDISSAIQMNLLGYAFIPGFQQDQSDEMKRTRESFMNMLNVSDFSYLENGQIKTIKLDPTTIEELKMAYDIAKTGIWPTF